MTYLPARQSVGFPTIAKIRKGTPKKIVERDGRESFQMGRDLKQKFRIEFLPGVSQEILDKWHMLHKEDYKEYGKSFVTQTGYELQYIRAMIPTERVMDGWRWNNETYNGSGMLIASADGERYWTKKDPVTMETLVKNGEPYTPFNYGEAISYTNSKGKVIKLQLKSTGKLDLFLPELGEFVCFELRTASYLDSLYIEKNLRAIQNIANAINGGLAGGIPLDIYRVEVETPYMGTDGNSHKGKQWFIQIKANSEWANNAIGRMNKFAMGQPVALLPADIPELPETAMEETDDLDEGITPEQAIEQIVTENVTDGVIKEEEVFSAEHWINAMLAEVDGKDKAFKKKAVAIFKEYEPSGNMRLITDVAKLEECYNKITKIK